MLKRQSLPTVLFRTPFTRTIKFHRAINYFSVTCHAIVYTYLLIKISPHACTSVTSLTHLKETWDSFSFKASREMYQGCKQLHECILRYRSVPNSLTPFQYRTSRGIRSLKVIKCLFVPPPQTDKNSKQVLI